MLNFAAIVEALRFLGNERAMRRAIERARDDKRNGQAVDVSNDFLRVVFDQRDITKRRPVRKWYAHRRTKKRGICFHHTAVGGGFGVDRKIVDALNDRPVNLDRFLGVDASTLTHEQWARAVALAHRYRGDPPRKFNEGVPYHTITGANSVLYLNLPFDFVTWHGNGANTNFIGHAWDANSLHDELAVEDLCNDVRFIVKRARYEGHPISEFTCHSAWTNKPNDPGKRFILDVVEPVAREFSIEIDWEFRASGGKSLADATR